MIGKTIVVSTTAAAILLAAIFQFQKPSSIGPIGLLGVFFLLYVVALGIITWFLWIISQMISNIGKHITVKKPPQALTLAQSYYFSSVIALAPIMMLAMQSIGSLGVYETVLVLIFVLVGILYISRRSLS